MKLRFWKREKKLPPIKDLVNAHEIHHVQSRSTHDTIEIPDLEYLSFVKCSCDNNLNDPHCKTHGIPDLSHLTKEDQCHGKLKSGARCSRAVKKAMYCYQHKRR